jgi:hypothetical protein
MRNARAGATGPKRERFGDCVNHTVLRLEDTAVSAENGLPERGREAVLDGRWLYRQEQATAQREKAFAHDGRDVVLDKRDVALDGRWLYRQEQAIAQHEEAFAHDGRDVALD